MKKKLVAIAVAGVLGAPLAAHAQTANVTLYGRMNLDLEFMKGTQADGTNPNTVRVSSNTSRFGLRGVESLGGGLNAIFQIESNIAGDAGNSLTAGRETFVGLQGGWGTVKMGNFLTTTDDMHAIFGSSPTFLTSIFSTAALWGQGPQSRLTGAFDSRNGNSLRYDSPSYSGFTWSGQVSLADNSTGGGAGWPGGDLTAAQNRHAYALGVNAIYTNGPLQIGADYDSNQKIRGATLNDDEFTITGGYNFGVVRIAGVYEYMKYETPTGDLKRDFYGISAIVPAGPGSFYAFWGHANDGKGSAEDGTTVGGLVKGPGTKADHWEITYTYPLSKRTSVYGGYTQIRNDTNAKYILNINNYPTATGGDPGGFVLGMIHLF
ncbi:MAG TPA: porin [Casimicrobiaceae bacterium]|nr:porin [Casimicrobiaceae bacterium]